MAVYDLEEQEQISQLKAWWEQYGKFITAVAVVVALASVGWQGWNWYQNRQAGEAAGLYFTLESAIESNDAARAREAAGKLIEGFPKSAYASMAALQSATLQFKQGDVRNAQAQLEWVAGNGSDPVLRDVARLRLATVLLEAGEHEQALARLGEAPAGELKPRFEDLRGDIHATAGRPEQARQAYQAALDALAAQAVAGGDTLAEVIRVKFEALEG